jgi:hypothetical protein
MPEEDEGMPIDVEYELLFLAAAFWHKLVAVIVRLGIASDQQEVLILRDLVRLLRSAASGYQANQASAQEQSQVVVEPH